MKQLFFSLLLSLSLVVPLQAQLVFGIKGGIAANDFFSPQFSKNVYHTHPSLIGGMVLGRQVTKKLALQAELLYSRQGAEIQDETTGIRLRYLNLPLQLKYFPVANSFLAAGLQYGALLSEDRTLDDGRAPELPEAFLEKDALRMHDLTLPVSIGYLSEAGVQLEVRYHFGLVNVFRDPQLESKNRTVQFTLTYFLQDRHAGRHLFTNEAENPGLLAFMR